MPARDWRARSCAPQPSSGITYAKKISKGETRIVFAEPARGVRNHIHGLSPAPGAWFAVTHEETPTRVKVLLCEAVDGRGKPGEVLDDRLTIACGEGAIRIVELQRAGKAPMKAAEFLRGTPLKPPARLV